MMNDGNVTKQTDYQVCFSLLYRSNVNDESDVHLLCLLLYVRLSPTLAMLRTTLPPRLSLILSLSQPALRSTPQFPSLSQALSLLEVSLVSLTLPDQRIASRYDWVLADLMSSHLSGQATGLITIPVNTITTAVAPTSLTTTLANTNTNPTSISASLSMSSVVSVSLSSARAASASASRAAAASSSPSTVGANSWGERKLTVSAVVLPALGGLCWAMAMLL